MFTPTLTLVNITILGNATPGGRTVTMTTGTEVASRSDGFTVGNLRVITSVTPNSQSAGFDLAQLPRFWKRATEK